MRRLLLSLALLPLLAACSNPSVRYDVRLDTDDEERSSMLLFASLRVIERRMASLGEEVIDLDIKKVSDGNQIYVEVKEEEAALDILTDLLTTPFDLQIMKEASAEEADQFVEGHGGFQKTGLNQEHILWLQAAEEPGGKGRVTISFSQEGRVMMSDIFKENKGKSIGIFVREQLVSKLLVDTDELKDDIVITDIPTVQLANVFADDVNVGLHVTFTPVP
jgi:preprotein translocase subunit SecD